MPETNCRCGKKPISLEARTPGKNRGRWYLKCPTGTCNFFKWDDSIHSFIKHPEYAYAAQQPLSGHRIKPNFQFRPNQKDQETSLTKTTVKVVFSVISKDLIGIKTQHNLTLNPVIAKIENIEWSDKYNQFVIPASVPMYNLAIASLPTDTPNLQIEIEHIPPDLLDSIIEATFLEVQERTTPQSDFMTEVEEKYTEFVESPLFNRLPSKVQREAVKIGIERKGRILFGNENGVGSIQEALALTKVYQEDWPVLVTCPGVLCQTWKQEIKQFLGLEQDEICYLDPKVKKSEMFTKKGLANQPNHMMKQQQKRKNPPNKTKMHQPYKKRMQKRLANPDYQSSSSEDEEEEEEENGKQEEERKGDIHSNKKVKFYVASHEHTSERRNEIARQKFKIIMCADSHLLKDWTKGESKFICHLIQKAPKAILISDCVRNATPVNIYNQTQAVAPSIFPKFDHFAKRYCDQKNTVFGLQYQGRCNTEEFDYLMDTNIWYCPRLKDLKADFPAAIKQPIILTGKRNTGLRRSVEYLVEMPEEDIDETDLDELVGELHIKTTEAKKEEILEYLDYILEIYRRPKIAIIYQNTFVFDFIKQHLSAKKIKFTHLNKNENAMDLCEEYNASQKVQFIILDMKLEDLNISLHAVDLVIFAELPFHMEKMSEFESFFKYNEREGPLMIKYLIAPDTIDDYLWPRVKSF